MHVVVVVQRQGKVFAWEIRFIQDKPQKLACKDLTRMVLVSHALFGLVHALFQQIVLSLEAFAYSESVNLVYQPMVVALMDFCVVRINAIVNLFVKLKVLLVLL